MSSHTFSFFSFTLKHLAQYISYVTAAARVQTSESMPDVLCISIGLVNTVSFCFVFNLGDFLYSNSLDIALFFMIFFFKEEDECLLRSKLVIRTTSLSLPLGSLLTATSQYTFGKVSSLTDIIRHGRKAKRTRDDTSFHIMVICFEVWSCQVTLACLVHTFPNMDSITWRSFLHLLSVECLVMRILFYFSTLSFK